MILFNGLNPLDQEAILEINIRGLQRLSGERKVSEGFFAPDGNIILIDTDRIGAFDQPHKNGIGQPAHYAGKGLITAAFNREFRGYAVKYMPTDYVPIENYFSLLPQQYRYRAAAHLPAKPVKVEFIARSTCEGSMEEKASEGESICGQELPKGLRLGQMLPRPYFTPTTKAPKGQKDEPITLDEYYQIIGDQHQANYLYGMTIVLHLANRSRARKRGLDRPDQKVEFGRLLEGTKLKWPKPMSKNGWAKRLSYLCAASGFDPSVWKRLPKFNFIDFCSYSNFNNLNQLFAVIDSGGGTDDGRYRPLFYTALGEEYYSRGLPNQAKAFMQEYLCKEWFRLYSKLTGKGGYSKSASEEVIVPDTILHETGRRNLLALLTLL